jgi:signal transduction histidine kinase
MTFIDASTESAGGAPLPAYIPQIPARSILDSRPLLLTFPRHTGGTIRCHCHMTTMLQRRLATAGAGETSGFLLAASPHIADYQSSRTRIRRYANLLKNNIPQNKTATRMSKKRAGKCAPEEAELQDSSPDGPRDGAVSHRPLSMERRKNSERPREVTEQMQELELLAKNLLRSQAAEQQTISRELHDNIAQVLSAITARISLAKDTAVPAWVRHELTDLREQLKAAIDDVRTLARDLRPSILDHNGFAHALEKQVDTFRDRTRITLEMQIDPKAASILDSESLTHLFRLAQEALRNIEEHSEATRAWLRLAQRDGHMHLEIGDNGNGFTAQRVTQAQRDGHLGLLGMRERAELLGGRFLLEAVPGQGTVLRITIPPRQNPRRKHR